MTKKEFKAWLEDCIKRDRDALYEIVPQDRSVSKAFDRGYYLGGAHTFEAVLNKLKQVKKKSALS